MAEKFTSLHGYVCRGNNYFRQERRVFLWCLFVALSFFTTNITQKSIGSIFMKLGGKVEHDTKNESWNFQKHLLITDGIMGNQLYKVKKKHVAFDSWPRVFPVVPERPGRWRGLDHDTFSAAWEKVWRFTEKRNMDNHFQRPQKNENKIKRTTCKQIKMLT